MDASMITAGRHLNDTSVGVRGDMASTRYEWNEDGTCTMHVDVNSELVSSVEVHGMPTVDGEVR